MGDFAHDHVMIKRRDNGSFQAVALSLCTHALLLLPLMTLTRHLTELPKTAMEVSIVPLPEQLSVPKPEPQTEPQPQPTAKLTAPPVKASPHPVRRSPPNITLPIPAMPPSSSTADATDSLTATGVEDDPAPAQVAATTIEANGHQTEISQYKMAVWEQIQHHRPNHVRVFGTTVILFTIAANGSLQNVEVMTPSGKTLLDQVALNIVKDAAPFPPPPPASAEQELTFSIPFEFH